MWLGGGRRVLLCQCRLRGSSCFLERLVLPWLCGIGGVGGWVGGFLRFVELWGLWESLSW